MDDIINQINYVEFLVISHSRAIQSSKKETKIPRNIVGCRKKRLTFSEGISQPLHNHQVGECERISKPSQTMEGRVNIPLTTENGQNLQ